MTKLYQKLLKSAISIDEIKRGVAAASRQPEGKERLEILRTIFSCIDLTSLNTTDNIRIIRQFAGKVSKFKEQFSETDNVAAICVFPNFVQPAREGLHKCGVRLAVVSASFPTSQTFLDVKISETEIAVSNGADEVDVVIPVGEFLDKKYETVIDEIKSLKQAAGEATLKVILETGLLNDAEQIYHASVIAMEAGADFIKTSTGKCPVSATPEAAMVMCKAILDYYNETGIMIGFKPAGGIAKPQDAIIYYNIVKMVLGEKWLNPTLFRVGASRLANSILGELYPDKPAYF